LDDFPDAGRALDGQRVGAAEEGQVPYGDRERSVRVDILVFDEACRSLNAYNIKRGNGSYDGGKRRHIHVIFYYGLLSLPRPLAISGDDLDEHFQFPVREAIELVNAYFVARLSALIEQED
jgi:hypothetical protein